MLPVNVNGAVYQSSHGAQCMVLAPYTILNNRKEASIRNRLHVVLKLAWLCGVQQFCPQHSLSIKPDAPC